MPPGTGSGAIKWHRKEMYLETDRTIIRSIQLGDEKGYVEMAKDGSLAEIGFEDTKKIGICFFVGTAYRRNGYVSEAVKKYILYIDDEKEELYRFYVIRRQ